MSFSDQELLARKGWIGASDSPAIMGASPWRTRMDIWRDKTSPEVMRIEDNEYMVRGRELELWGREMFESILAKHGEVEERLPARDVIHPEYPFIRASLDCANSEGPVRIFAEIKAQWEKDWAVNAVPEKYEWQLHHQFLVTGATRGYFIGIHHKRDEIKVIRLERNEEKIQRLLSALIHFWYCVQSGTPPEPTDQEYVQVSYPEAEMHALEYTQLTHEIERLEARRELVKEMMLAQCKHPKTWIGHLKLNKITRVGQIDYKSIPEIQYLDLEQYRRPSSEFWKISE